MQLRNTELLRNRSYVNGKWIEASQKGEFIVTNPFDGSVLAIVPDMGVEDVLPVVAAADEAFHLWKNKTADDRSVLVRQWYDLVVENEDDLAQLITFEQGKPIQEAKGEIKYAASFMAWFAEEATRVYGDVIPGHGEDKRILTIKQPVGVVVAITPWNFPAAMVTRKIAPAIAAGCTIILKPAEATPLTALALAYLAEKAGIPAGVINVITTNRPGPVASALLIDSRVRKVSFTGSTEVGKQLLKQSAETVKKVSLELGGNAPFIVFKDANITEAVKGAIASKYRNTGQTCVCANRIFVHESVFHQFVKQFTEEVNRLQTGNGMDNNVQIGPMINEKAVKKVEYLIQDAVTTGASIICGGKRQSQMNTFFQPTILTDVNEQMEIHQAEIFGPVAPIYKFSSEQEVLDRANDTSYGLAAYFYGNNMNQIWRVAEALDYGMVGINTGMISTTKAPFGGIKESGMGKEGSKYGMDEYLVLKYLCFGNIKSTPD